MLLASSRTIPPAPVLSAFSEPAKSTRTIFPVFDLLVQSHIVGYLVILNLLKTRREVPSQLNYIPGCSEIGILIPDQKFLSCQVFSNPSYSNNKNNKTYNQILYESL